MRALRPAQLGAFTFLICASASGMAHAQEYERTPARAALSDNWLSYDDTLEPKHLNRIFALIENDPRAAALLARVRAVTGKQSALELMAVISLCPEVDRDGDGISLHGHFDPDGPTGSTDVAQPDPAQRTMCVSKNLSVAEALETFVHEFTHFVRFGAYCSSDPDVYDQSEGDYAIAAIQQPGDEVDAFLEGMGAQIRVARSRHWLNPIYRELFDDSGRYLGTREELARLLLVDPGYRDKFSARFDECKRRLKSR